MNGNHVSPAVLSIRHLFPLLSFPDIVINNMKLNEDIPCPRASFSNALISVVASALAPLPSKGISLRRLGALSTISRES